MARTLCMVERRMFTAAAVAALVVGLITTAAARGDQGGDLLESIRKGDVPAVKKLLSADIDVNQLIPEDKTNFRSVTPLYAAVSLENTQIVSLLLDKKADPNVEIEEAESPGPHDTPLANASRRGNSDIAKLLIARGARVTALSLMAAKNDEMKSLLMKNIKFHELRAFYLRRIRDAVDEADTTALAAVAAVMGGLAWIDCPDAILVWYANAPLPLREVVNKYGPKELATSQLNALDVLLSRGITARDSTKFPTLPFPLTTSFLANPKDALHYAAARAADGDIATLWAEGVEGPGIGQKIAVRVPEKAAAVTVVPGHGNPKFRAQNNRVKSARMTLFALADINEAGTWVSGHTYLVRKLGEAVLDFADELQAQQAPLPVFQATLEGNESLLAALEILQVHKGEKFDDTCIAEIGFVDSAGRKLPSR